MSGAPSGGAAEVHVLCTLDFPSDLLAGGGVLAATSPGGSLHVRLSLVDVTLADAPSTSLDEVVAVVDREPRLSGPFELVGAVAPGRHLAVQAHVDVSGDGALAPGDLITTARVAVPTGTVLAEVRVPLTRLP